MRRVESVLHSVALGPSADRLSPHSVLIGQRVVAARGLLNRRPDGWRRRGVLVQLAQHETSGSSNPAPTAFKTSLLISNGRRDFRSHSSGTRQVTPACGKPLESNVEGMQLGIKCCGTDACYGSVPLAHLKPDWPFRVGSRPPVAEWQVLEVQRPNAPLPVD